MQAIVDPSSFTLDDAPFLSSSYPLFGSLGYLVVIYGLQTTLSLVYGKKAEPQKPEKKNMVMHFLVQLHNVNLIVLSLAMLCGIVYGAYEQATKSGFFRGLICPLDSEESPVQSGKYQIIHI